MCVIVNATEDTVSYSYFTGARSEKDKRGMKVATWVTIGVELRRSDKIAEKSVYYDVNLFGDHDQTFGFIFFNFLP